MVFGVRIHETEVSNADMESLGSVEIYADLRQGESFRGPAAI